MGYRQLVGEDMEVGTQTNVQACCQSKAYVMHNLNAAMHMSSQFSTIHLLVRLGTRCMYGTLSALVHSAGNLGDCHLVEFMQGLLDFAS